MLIRNLFISPLAEPLALGSTEDEDLDEAAIDASLPEAIWGDGIWE